jgi:tetratricopeptide (TPR) repeat protein
MNKIAMMLLAAIFLTGCSLAYRTQGTYYLKNEQYSQGRTAFEENVRNAPNDAIAHYYLGRFYLAEEQFQKGLRSLQHSASLGAPRADTYFWIGVAYSHLKQPKKERDSYRQALSIDTRHIQARTYLAHNQLENNEMKKALANYEKVLSTQPENIDALYNRAIVFGRLGQKSKEEQALKSYLLHYPSGSLARLAVDRLNQIGDYEYRNYVIGPRIVTLKQVRFNEGTVKITPEYKPSLNVVGSILTNNPQLSINVVVYQKNSKHLAENRAKNIKKYLLSKFPTIAANRVRLSWFPEPETIRVKGNAVIKLEEAVNIFSFKNKAISRRVKSADTVI